MGYSAVAIIPARFDSRRFPGKPLVRILGTSLIQRTYENAHSSGLFCDVVIATDDERILRHSQEFGAKAVMTSSSHRSGTERIAEVKDRFYPDAEFVLNLQGDEPLLKKELMKNLLEKIQTKGVSIATAVAPLREEDRLDPSVVKCVFNQEGRALYFSRSLIPFGGGPAYQHLGVYAFCNETLSKIQNFPPSSLRKSEDLEQLGWLDAGIDLHVVQAKSATIGVDHPSDIEKVERELCAESTSS